MAAIAAQETQIISPDFGSALYAFDTVPLVNSVGNMPCFINFPGRLIENRLIGSDERGREFNETRMWDLVLYHSPVGSGTPEEKSGLLIPYLELVLNQFGAHPRLAGTQGVREVLITGDSGVGVVEFMQNQYWGIRFQLRVVRQVRRLLAESD
jgi:hypothetical protein